MTDFHSRVAQTLFKCSSMIAPDGDRQATHGDFDAGLEATGQIIDILSALPFWGVLAPGQRVALSVTVQKMVRIANGGFNPDDWIDAINYLAAGANLGGETENVEHPPWSDLRVTYRGYDVHVSARGDGGADAFCEALPELALSHKSLEKLRALIPAVIDRLLERRGEEKCLPKCEDCSFFEGSSCMRYRRRFKDAEMEREKGNCGSEGKNFFPLVHAEKGKTS